MKTTVLMQWLRIESLKLFFFWLLTLVQSAFLLFSNFLSI
ncbi:hypothetical protein GXM_10377 [Nostoc sphaeroides CCNUC1]|uniref:Uncharacterized protein n=1 Tax=Nostoc sphaeroides CCNUC1 TaxID=2653204 RepID=A0A5P8WJK0_9NOSO|nr:hypothetical protein GXM_10377 [Nostoc sphaeroides CCNUC1]